MKRAAVVLVMLSLVLGSANALAQKKTGKEPPKQKPVMIEEMYKGTRYLVIPYEVIYPESHAQLQAMFPDKFQFFYVVIDNRQGQNTVTFDPKSGDVTILLKKSGRYTAVNLSNTFADKSAAAKISQAFRDAYVPIEVPKGEMKHTILVFSLFNIGDIRSALWSFPGETPKEMKGKPLRVGDAKRYKLEPIGGEKEKKGK